MFSINDLDVSKSCETPFEFEVKNDETGKGTGIFLSVIGSHAQAITDFTTQWANERRVADAMAEKRDPRGKNLNVHKVEDDIEFSTEIIAMRVVAWRGISDPYSHAGAVKLCTINPPIKEQILGVSDNLKNYPIAFSKSLPLVSDKAPG